METQQVLPPELWLESWTCRSVRVGRSPNSSSRDRTLLKTGRCPRQGKPPGNPQMPGPGVYTLIKSTEPPGQAGAGRELPWALWTGGPPPPTAMGLSFKALAHVRPEAGDQPRSYKKEEHKLKGTNKTKKWKGLPAHSKSKCLGLVPATPPSVVG